MTQFLVPFDGSPSAGRAIDFLAGYAADPAALAAVVLNVQERPAAFWPQGALDVTAVEKALLEAGSLAIAPALERLGAAHIRATSAVRLGLAAETILREGRAQAVAAIVMGTRGHGLLQGFALGSVAMRVAHGGEAPLLLVKPDARLPAALGKRLRVLLAMDGSAPAIRAAERLAAWRSWLGELEVEIAWVQPPLTYLETVLPPHDDVIGQWSTQEGEKATQAAREVFRREGIAHHLHLSVGDPALEVRALAEQTGAELVALGTRGLGAAHHALVGSVALKSAALGSVPTLLVP